MAMVPRTQTLLEIAPIALSPAPIQKGMLTASNPVLSSFFAPKTIADIDVRTARKKYGRDVLSK